MCRFPWPAWGQESVGVISQARAWKERWPHRSRDPAVSGAGAYVSGESPRARPAAPAPRLQGSDPAPSLLAFPGQGGGQCGHGESCLCPEGLRTVPWAPVEWKVRLVPGQAREV